MVDTTLFLIFLLEVFLVAILLFYIKIADDWVLESIIKLEKEGESLIELIKEIREDLIKLNKILNFIREFKISKIRKIILKTIDIINIFILFHPKDCKSVKLKKFLGLKIFKGLLLAFKPV